MTEHYDRHFGGRNIVIHICKDGTISYRDKAKGEKVFNGVALPVFAVDTVEQAESIQLRFGRLQYSDHPQMPGKPWFKWTDFSGDQKDLDKVAAAILRFWENTEKVHG